MAKKPRNSKGDDIHLTRRQMLQRLGNYSAIAAGVLFMAPAPVKADDIAPILQLLLGDEAASEFDEDFETGDFSKYPWVFGGDANWVIVSDEKCGGTYSAKSGDISHDQQSTLEITLDVPEGTISFHKKVSSEPNYDFLQFFIDDTLLGSWSGEVQWSREEFSVTSGRHSFKWRYYKDYSVDGNADCAYLDKIVITSDPQYGDWCDYGDWTDYSDWTDDYSVYGRWQDWDNYYVWGAWSNWSL